MTAISSANKNLKQALREQARVMGALLFGVADLETLGWCKPDLLDEAPGPFIRALALAVPLNHAVLNMIDHQPTPLYAHHYAQVNYMLDRIALALAMTLEAGGYLALPIPAS